MPPDELRHSRRRRKEGHGHSDAIRVVAGKLVSIFYPDNLAACPVIEVFMSYRPQWDGLGNMGFSVRPLRRISLSQVKSNPRQRLQNFSEGFAGDLPASQFFSWKISGTRYGQH
jgi:hypothetical protein